MSTPLRPDGVAAGIRSGGPYTPPDSVAAGKFLTAEVVSPYEVRVSVDKTGVPFDDIAVASNWNFTDGFGNANISGSAVFLGGDLYINDEDADGVNQSAVLSALTAGDVIYIGSWSFSVATTQDNGSHWQYTGTASGTAPDDGEVEIRVGAWLELALTSNPQGDPVTNLDGFMLARLDTTAVDGWVTLRDTHLQPGRWMHYGLFAKYDFSGSIEWVRVATTEVLVPETFNHSQRMFNALPRWYQDADDATTEHLVQRFMNAFGLEADITRTWVETLGHVWDPAKVPARLLKPMSEVMGLPYERTVGDPRVRKLLSNLIYLRKTKGTRESIEGYLTALSGYKVLAHQSLNIMLTVEDAEFREGVGNWVAGINSTIERLPTPVDVGAPPDPQGVLEVKRTGSTGTVEATSGNGTRSQSVRIEPGTGRQVQVSVNARTISGSANLRIRVDFYDSDGLFVDFGESAALGITNVYDRVRTGWLTVPDFGGAVLFADFSVRIDSAVVGAGFRMGQIMLVDRRWRPEYLPGYVNAEPFSESGDTRYTGYDFYDSPRTVWLNIFPQRTNFAVNSDFTLDNLPADGWTVVDAPTYGSLPFAYATYALVSGTETDYADLAEGFDSITPTWTATFDTANKRMVLTSSGTAPYIAQVRSKAFPVLPGLAYSAAMEMQSNTAGSKATLRIQWMATDDSNTALLDADGVPVVSESQTIDLETDRNVRVELRNAIAPEGAGWGRLIVESANAAAHITYCQHALIEDSAMPGSYFNGDVTEGAPDDFGYVGTAKQSFSVYYLNFTAVLGSATNRVLTAAQEVLPLHVNEPRITSAYEGLYDELA